VKRVEKGLRNSAYFDPSLITIQEMEMVLREGWDLFGDVKIIKKINSGGKCNEHKFGGI
jgi:hypothetical protein